MSSNDFSRRTLLASAGGVAAVAAAVSMAKPAEAAPATIERPRGKRRTDGRYNILMIVTDQQRSFADVPKSLPMPGQDMIRRRGVSFDNYLINTNPCGPSRAVMYTGQHTQQNGVYLNPNSQPFPELRKDIPTIGHMLRDAGYYTTYKGKWHLSDIELPQVSERKLKYPRGDDLLEPFGFSDYNFDGERVGLTWQGFMDDGTTAAEAINTLRDLEGGKAGDKPWFMAVNFVNPHDIMFFDARGDGEKTRIMPNLIAPLFPAPGDPIYDADWKAPLPKSFYADDLSTKPSAHAAIRAASWAFYGKLDHADEAAWQRFQNYYFNCIRDVDRHVAAVMTALEESGQIDDTIVIYTSDHGERGGAHGLRQKAGTVYKEDIGVPFVIAHPKGAKGQQTAALGTTLDIAPTLLSMAGVDAAKRPATLKGHDLTPAAMHPDARTGRDQQGSLLNYAVAYGWNQPDVPPGVENVKPLAAPDVALRRLYRGVFDGRYKFARYFAPDQHHIPTSWEMLTRLNDLELYDTLRDPDEIVNLASPANREKNRALILRLSKMTNALIAREVGVDDGALYKGQYKVTNKTE